MRLCSGWGTGFLSYLKIAFQRFTFPVPLFRPDSSNGRTQLVCPYEVNSCKLVVSFDKSFFAVGISVRVRFGALIINTLVMKKKVTIGFPVAVGFLSYLGCVSSAGLAFSLAALAVVIVFGLYLQYSR